jgi:hypothetical protein
MTKTEMLTLTVKLSYMVIVVLDHVTQVRDVVFVNCIFSFGKPQGVGISE